MTMHPIYKGDLSINWMSRPCAAAADEGSCEDVARQLGVNPQSGWTRPASGRFGWVCDAHHNAMTARYDPEYNAAQRAQLAAEGREFWQDYGLETGEVPRLSRRMAELDSLNSDTR